MFLTNFWRLLRGETPAAQNAEAAQLVDAAVTAAIVRHVTASMELAETARETARALGGETE